MPVRLSTKYRPRNWSEVVAQDKVLRKIDMLRSRGLAGRAYWVTGQSGTGITTIATLLAEEIAGSRDVKEVVAAGAGIKDVEDVARFLTFQTPPASSNVVLIHDVHVLTRRVAAALGETLDRLPENASVVFTVRVDAEQELMKRIPDARTLLQRCVQLKLARRDLAQPFAERAQEIAREEGLGDAPIEAFLKLARKNRNSFRAMLRDIESGCMLTGVSGEQ